MLKGKFVGSYRSKNKGVPVFRYEVTGNDADLKAYEEVQGENYRDNEAGVPLFFTTRYNGDNIDIIITGNGKVIADTSKFDKAASLAAAYGGNLGQELARAAALELLGGTKGNSPVSQPAPQGEAAGSSLDKG